MPAAPPRDGAAPPLDGVVAAALAEHRDRCNSLVAAARRGRAAFDVDLLSTQVRGPLAVIVEACEQAVPGSGSAVLAALFGPIVELVGQHRLGGGSHDELLAALPRLAPALASEPKRVFGSLANAVLVLARFGLPVAGWLDRVVAVAQVGGDPDDVLRGGQVAAWAIGLAHYRGSALSVAAGLGPEAMRAALDAPEIEDVAATVDRLATRRWWRPDQPDPDDAAAPAAPRHRVGDFRGFGGPFLEAPLVAADADAGAIRVRSGTGVWHLHADAFGATLTRADGTGATDTQTTSPPAGIDHVTSAAQVSDVVALTTATSYRVLVFEASRS